LGMVLDNTNQRREAEKEYRRAGVLLEQIPADQRSHPEYREQKAKLLMNLGTLLASTGRMPAAIESSQQSAVIRKKLVDDFQNVPDYRTTLVMVCVNLGVARQRTRAFQGAAAA